MVLSRALVFGVSPQPLISPCFPLNLLLVPSVLSRSLVKILKKMGCSFCPGELYFLPAPGPVSPAVQSVCKPIFPLCPDKTAIGNNVRNPTKVLFYSPSVWSIISSRCMQLLERNFKRIFHVIFSGTEITLTTSESCSLPFLKMGKMLSFPQSSSGSSVAMGFHT